MAKIKRTSQHGGVLIAIGLLGIFFHTFPGILLLLSVIVMILGVLQLP